MGRGMAMARWTRGRCADQCAEGMCNERGGWPFVAETGEGERRARKHISGPNCTMGAQSGLRFFAVYLVYYFSRGRPGSYYVV